MIHSPFCSELVRKGLNIFPTRKYLSPAFGLNGEIVFLKPFDDCFNLLRVKHFRDCENKLGGRSTPEI